MNGLVLKLNIENEQEIDKTKAQIKEQIPKQGIKLKSGENVICEIVK